MAPHLWMNPPTNSTSTDPLISRASSTVDHIDQVSDQLTYIRFSQQLNVAAPPQDLGHPATALLEDYVANGFPVEVGPECSPKTIWNAIGKGTQSSTLSPNSTSLCRKEILERTHQAFSIVLWVIKYIALFGVTFCIYHLALVDQVNHKPRLI